MKTLFIIADVHSFYFEMMNALRAAGYDKDNPDHIFVSLGDLLDRGDYPIACMNFVNSIPSDRKILIRGNHEDLIEECLERKEFYQHDEHNGTMRTVMELAGRKADDVYDYFYYKEYGKDFVEFSTPVEDYHTAFDKVAKNESLKKYLDSLVDYAEIDGNIFVHAWIPCDIKYDKNHEIEDASYRADWRDADHAAWAAARWPNGMELYARGVKEPNETIFCGHWHTSWGHAHIEGGTPEWGTGASYAPFVAPGIVALDACTAVSRSVNCYVIKCTDEAFECAKKEK